VTGELSKELNMEKLIQLVVLKVQSLLRSERCTVFILDTKTQELYTNSSLSHGMGAA
jgi:hypothetical protein